MKRVLQSLRGPKPPELPEPPPVGSKPESGSVEALREAWSRYPGEWREDSALRRGADTLGDEWGGPEFADLMMDLVADYLGPEVDVLELGCGGGKFSGRLAPRCRSLLCTDISKEMIEHTRTTLNARGLDANVDYKVLNGVDFTGVPDESVDFIFSYDVLIHLQPENVFSYLNDARRVLREQGVFMLHQLRLDSNGGIEHFLTQYFAGSWRYEENHPRRRGYMHFTGRDEMRTLAELARLVVVDIVDDFPPRDSRLWSVTSGRDLIGFFRLMPGRLRHREVASVRLVQTQDSEMVYAVLDGSRAAFMSAWTFLAGGFSMQNVELISREEFEALPEAEPLAPWE